ncbi:hypothetical protein Ae201684P_018458 [Aphanomyces euteiches]|nr:hypothetical protein Ae201684P_018458 [Aphanomyces euteiches]
MTDKNILEHLREQTLKDQLAKRLDMPAKTFKLFRDLSDNGQELTALDMSFENLKLFDLSALFLAAGQPLTVEEFHAQSQFNKPTPQTTERSFFSKAGRPSWSIFLQYVRRGASLSPSSRQVHV